MRERAVKSSEKKWSRGIVHVCVREREREGLIQQGHTYDEVQAVSDGFQEKIGMIAKKA
jgi:hypothetical protein